MYRPIADFNLASVARIAGIGYLIIFFSGFFANFFVLETLISPQDAAATAGNIMANDTLFRIAILSFILMVLFDVVLTWALYILFKPVNGSLSLFAAWLRLVNCAVFAIALSHLFNILYLISDVEYLKTLEISLLQAQIMFSLKAFHFTWLIGLIFFGIHLLVLAYLILSSGIVPRVLGILLLMASAGYLIDSLANFLLRDYAAHQEIFLLIVALPGVVGELSFSMWLLFKGVNAEEVSSLK